MSTTPTDILLMIAQQIAAAARRAYSDREVRVHDGVTRVRRGQEAFVVIDSDWDSLWVSIQATPEGVHGRGYWDDDNHLLAEWSDPDFAGKVAAGISELAGEPFPADWMEVEV